MSSADPGFGGPAGFPSVKRGDVDAIVGVAQTAGAPKVLDPEKPVGIVVPAGATLQLPDLSAWRQAPTRKRGVYLPATVDSFAAYVEQHLIPGQTTIWVHPSSGAVTAVFDDHGSAHQGPGVPGFGQHRAELALGLTPEWLYWESHDREMLSQESFAEHVEGGMEEILEPDAAVMLEVAQTFHATNSATFRSSTRLHSGEQRLQYDEELQASAGAAGDLTVPTTLLLGIAPFIGEEPYRIAARMRFRLSSGVLRLGYQLDRPESVKQHALTGVAERLTERFQLTYVGEAPRAS